MKDIVIVSVPYTIIEVPPLSLAVLKGAVEHHGFSCLTLDLGMELLLSLNKERKLFEDIQLYFYEPDNVVNYEHRQYAENFIDTWAKNLLNYNPRWIGISVFSRYSQTATYLLVNRIKQLKPDTKIVLGGNGAGVHILDESRNLFNTSNLENILSFDDFLKKRQLIDSSIKGDGEKPLVQLLTRDIINDKQFFYSDYASDKFPFANFDDFKLEHYEGQKGRIQLPVFTSKGCVRNCDFCDVNPIQGNKYRYRTGKNLVEEMIFLKKKYKINDFLFNDSLANGSIKNLKDMCTGLAKWNNENPLDKIRWSASGWISRPAGQTKSEFYNLLAQSGLDSVSIGVETGSNTVLEAMDKKTTVDGVFWDAENFQKNDIRFIALMIVGHWSEQWEDFVETCSMFVNLIRYARSGTLQAVNLGLTFSVETDVPVWTEYRLINGLQRKNSSIWWTDKNPNLTYKERYFRWLLLHRLLEKLKISLMSEGLIKGVYIKLEENLETARKWYNDVVPDQDKIIKYAEYYYKNFDEFFNLLIDKTNLKEKKCSLRLEIEVESTDKILPGLQIKNKNIVLLDKTFEEGFHTIDIENISLFESNELIFSFYNKGQNDTVLNENGEIVKDKYIKIKKIILDNIDLLEDPEYYYNNLEYYENNERVYPKDGFWINEAKLICKFSDPFILTYNELSNRFSKFDAYAADVVTVPGSAIETYDINYYRKEIVKKLESLAF